MKYEDLDKAEQLRREIVALDADIAIANDRSQGYLGVTLSGRYQDDAMVNAVRDAVLGTLQVRKIEKQQALQKLGVKIGDMTPEPITDWFRLDYLDSILREKKTLSFFPVENDPDDGIRDVIDRHIQQELTA